MSLIAILLSLWFERLFGALEDFRQYHWFHRFAVAVRARLPHEGPWDGTPGLLLIVIPPFLAAGLVQYILADFSLLLALVYAVATLLYTLGPRDLEAQVEAYADAVERGDDASARWYANEILVESPEGLADETRAVARAVLVGANDRLIAILFWFVLLGPMGALLYRLTELLVDRFDDGKWEGGGMADPAGRLYAILAWPAARLCALGYALSGRFVEAMAQLRHYALHWPDPNREVLVETGFAAIAHREPPAVDAVHTAPIREALGLARRTVWIGLTVLALFTLAGWAG